MNMEKNNAPLLEMRNIKKGFFGNQVLTDINFTLKEGEVLGLVGENGAGKSTMQNAICGTWQPDEGSIELDGVNVSSLPEYKRARYLGLGLEDRLTTKVGTLSGGQRQALTLLMATLQKPKLLLLDEHTAALDPQTAQRVMDITDRLVRENHLTTLMITHNMRDAIHYGNRLLMLHNGRIVLDISGEEKARLTVPDLLALFSKVSGQEYDNDRALLA